MIEKFHICKTVS